MAEEEKEIPVSLLDTRVQKKLQPEMVQIQNQVAALANKDSAVNSIAATVAHYAESVVGYNKNSKLAGMLQTAYSDPEKYLGHGKTEDDVEDNKTTAIAKVFIHKQAELASQIYAQYRLNGHTADESAKLTQEHVNETLRDVITLDKDKAVAASKFNDIANSMYRIRDGKIYTNVSNIKAKDTKDTQGQLIETPLFSQEGFVSQVDADTEVSFWEKFGGKLAESTGLLGTTAFIAGGDFASRLGTGTDAIMNDETATGASRALWSIVGIAGALTETLLLSKLGSPLAKVNGFQYVPKFIPALTTVGRGIATSLAEQEMGANRIYWDTGEEDKYQYSHNDALWQTALADAATYTIGMGVSGLGTEQFMKLGFLKNALTNNTMRQMATLPWKTLIMDTVVDTSIDFFAHNMTNKIVEYTEGQELSLGFGENDDFGDMAVKFLTNAGYRAGARMGKGFASRAYRNIQRDVFGVKELADFASDSFIDKVAAEEGWGGFRKNIAKWGEDIYPMGWEAMDKTRVIHNQEDLRTFLDKGKTKWKDVSPEDKLNLLGKEILLNESNSNFVVSFANKMRTVFDPNSMRIDGDSQWEVLKESALAANTLGSMKYLGGNGGREAGKVLADRLYETMKPMFDENDAEKKGKVETLFKYIVHDVKMDEETRNAFNHQLLTRSIESTDSKLQEYTKQIIQNAAKPMTKDDAALERSAQNIVKAIFNDPSLKEGIKQGLITKNGTILPMNNDAEFKKSMDYIGKFLNKAREVTIWEQFETKADPERMAAIDKVKNEFVAEFKNVMRDYEGSGKDLGDRVLAMDSLKKASRQAAQAVMDRKIKSIKRLYKGLQNRGAGTKIKDDVNDAGKLAAKQLSELATMHSAFAEVTPGALRQFTKEVKEDPLFRAFLDKSLESAGGYFKDLDIIKKSKGDDKNDPSLILKLIASMNVTAIQKVEGMYNIFNSARENVAADAIITMKDIMTFLADGGMQSKKIKYFKNLFKRSGYSVAQGESGAIEYTSSGIRRSVMQTDFFDVNHFLMSMVYNSKRSSFSDVEIANTFKALGAEDINRKIDLMENIIQLTMAKALAISEDGENQRGLYTDYLDKLKKAGLVSSTGMPSLRTDETTNKMTVENFELDRNKIQNLLTSPELDPVTKLNPLMSVLFDNASQIWRRASVVKDAYTPAVPDKDKDFQYIMMVGDKRAFSPKEIFDKSFVKESFDQGANLHVILTQLLRMSEDRAEFTKYLTETLQRVNLKAFNSIDADSRKNFIEYVVNDFYSKAHIELTLSEDLQDIILGSFVEPNAMNLSRSGNMTIVHISKKAEESIFKDMKDDELLNKYNLIRLKSTGVNNTVDYVVVYGGNNQERTRFLLSEMIDSQDNAIKAFEDLDGYDTTLRTETKARLEAIQKDIDRFDGNMSNPDTIKYIKRAFDSITDLQLKHYTSVLDKHKAKYLEGENKVQEYSVQQWRSDTKVVEEYLMNQLRQSKYFNLGDRIYGMMKIIPFFEMIASNKVSVNDPVNKTRTTDEFLTASTKMVADIETYNRLDNVTTRSVDDERAYQAAIRGMKDFNNLYGSTDFDVKPGDIEYREALNVQAKIYNALNNALSKVNPGDLAGVEGLVEAGSKLGEGVLNLLTSAIGDPSKRTVSTYSYSLEDKITEAAQELFKTFNEVQDEIYNVLATRKEKAFYKADEMVQVEHARQGILGRTTLDPNKGDVVGKQILDGVEKAVKFLKGIRDKGSGFFDDYWSSLSTAYSYLSFGDVSIHEKLFAHKRLGMLSIRGTDFNSRADFEKMMERHGQTGKLKLIIVPEIPLSRYKGARPLADGTCVVPDWIHKEFSAKSLELEGGKQTTLAGANALKLNVRKFSEPDSGYRMLLDEATSKSEGDVFLPDDTIIISMTAWKAMDQGLVDWLEGKLDLGNQEGRQQAVNMMPSETFGNCRVITNIEGDDVGHKLSRHIVSNTFRHSSPSPHAGRINYPNQSAVADLQMRFALNTGLISSMTQTRQELANLDIDKEGGISSYVNKIKSIIGIQGKMQGSYQPLQGMEKQGDFPDRYREYADSLANLLKQKKQLLESKGVAIEEYRRDRELGRQITALKNATEVEKQKHFEARTAIEEYDSQMRGFDKKIRELSKAVKMAYIQRTATIITEEVGNAYKAGIDMDPDSMVALYNKADELYKDPFKNEMEEVRSVLTKFLVDPEIEQLRVELGVIRENIAALKDAIATAKASRAPDAKKQFKDFIASYVAQRADITEGIDEQSYMKNSILSQFGDISTEDGMRKAFWNMMASRAYHFAPEEYQYKYRFNGEDRVITSTGQIGDVTLLKQVAERFNADMADNKAQFGNFTHDQIVTLIKSMTNTLRNKGYYSEETISSAMEFLSIPDGKMQMFEKVEHQDASGNTKTAYVFYVGRTPFIHDGSLHASICTGIKYNADTIALSWYDQVVQNADFDGDQGMHFASITSVKDMHELSFDDAELRRIKEQSKGDKGVELLEMINRRNENTYRRITALMERGLPFNTLPAASKDMVHKSTIDHTMDSGALIYAAMEGIKFFTAAAASRSQRLGSKPMEIDFSKELEVEGVTKPGEIAASYTEKPTLKFETDTHRDKFALYKHFDSVDGIRNSFGGSFSKAGFSDVVLEFEEGGTVKQYIVGVATTKDLTGKESPVAILCSAGADVPGLKIEAFVNMKMDADVGDHFENQADLIAKKIQEERNSASWKDVHDAIARASGDTSGTAAELSRNFAKQNFYTSNLQTLHYTIQQTSVDAPANHALYAFMNRWKNTGNGERVISEMTKMIAASRFASVRVTPNEDGTFYLRNNTLNNIPGWEKAVEAGFRKSMFASKTIAAVADKLVDNSDNLFLSRDNYNEMMNYNKDGRTSFEDLIRNRPRFPAMVQRVLSSRFFSDNMTTTQKMALMYLPVELTRAYAVRETINDLPRNFIDKKFFDRYGLNPYDFVEKSIDDDGVYLFKEDENKVPKIVGLMKMIGALEETVRIYSNDGLYSPRQAAKLFKINADRYAQSTEFHSTDAFIQQVVKISSNNNKDIYINNAMVESILTKAGLQMTIDKDFTSDDMSFFARNVIDLDKITSYNTASNKKLLKMVKDHQKANGYTTANVVKFVDKSSAEKDFMSSMDVARKLEAYAQGLEQKLRDKHIDNNTRRMLQEEQRQAQSVIGGMFSVLDAPTRTILALRSLGMSAEAADAISEGELQNLKIDPNKISDFTRSAYYANKALSGIAEVAINAKTTLEDQKKIC